MANRKLLKQQVIQHERWVKEEGAVEHPTHIETLLQPEQQKRISWLKEHCGGATEILDIGCNRGWVLTQLNGRCGIDINPENIELAKQEYCRIRDVWFRVADVTKGLDFIDEQFAVVVCADLLEHLEWFGDVETALQEGVRIARQKLLITLPWREDEKCRYCFKHAWTPSEEKVGQIATWLMLHAGKVTIECDGNFVYIEAIK